MIERLFDIVEQRVQRAPDLPMLAAKSGGDWKAQTAREAWQTALYLAGGLQALFPFYAGPEVEQMEKVGIISQNRPEWLLADLAVQVSGGVLTPIYPTVAPDDLRYILREAGMRILFIADKDLYRRFKEVILEQEGLQVYSFDPVDGLPGWQSLSDRKLMPDESLMRSISGERLATIIYTSGTTGHPKGVMLSHRNLVSNVIDCMPVFTFAGRNDRALSFLPLNHVFERMVSYVYLNADVAIYYAEGMETIGDNLREVKPLVFTTVPRLLEKVYERILSKGYELKGIKRALFFWALNLARQFDNHRSGSLFYRAQLALANKLVFSKWREALGGNVKAIVTGSAACQERLIRIFTAAGIVIMEGYGLTETSPVVTVNRFESEGRLIGSIGPLIDNVSVRLAEDGEILVKGSNVMQGYYKQPDLTREVLQDDGWFHTGDIGQWIDGKFLKITDRKKEIFKTSGGKYVAPQPIENKMKESPYIEQIMVVGADRKFTAALIVPSFSAVKQHLRDKGVPANTSNADLVKLKPVHELIRKQLDKYNPLFGHPEQVKKFLLLPQEWTIDSGELTPSLKLRRKVIQKKFEQDIDGLYE